MTELTKHGLQVMNNNLVQAVKMLTEDFKQLKKDILELQEENKQLRQFMAIKPENKEYEYLQKVEALTEENKRLKAEIQRLTRICSFCVKEIAW